MISRSFIWWNQIHGPSRLLKKITDTLCEEKSCALFFTENIPWYSYFSEYVKNTLTKMNSFKSTDFIDASQTDFIFPDDAGRYLAERYCSEKVLEDYWPGDSYASFLAQNDSLLGSRYIWVRGLNEDNFQAWYDFIIEYSGYQESARKKAAFFLECPFECTTPKNKTVRITDWNEEVHHYDYYMFCSVLVSELSCSDELKKYISDLAYNFSEFHAEFAAALLEYEIKLAENPKAVFEKCADSFKDTNGSALILDNYYTADHTVLEVQIKNIFPALERYRMNFVTKYYRGIAAFLPAHNPLTDEVISQPYECELNLLRKMTDGKRLSTTSDDMHMIRKMHSTRNKIAHNRLLDFELIRELLNG